MSIAFAPPTSPSISNLYPAQVYGGIWDGSSGHDVGAAINVAIAAAATAGGGTVVIPAGTFYFATPIVQNTSGVGIAGAGRGIPRDTVTPSHVLGVTRLIWNGASGATALTVKPASLATEQQLYCTDLVNFIVDGGNLAGVCVEMCQVMSSTIKLLVAESNPTNGINFWGTTLASGGEGFGFYGNDIWLETRCTNGANNNSLATGALFDGGSGSAFNACYNRIHELSIHHSGGDGAVFGYSDTNQIYQISSYRYGSLTSGSPLVFANSNYKSPNGVSVTGATQDNLVLFTGSAIWAVGATSGATFTPNPGNTGSATMGSVSLTTSAATTSGSTLTFSTVSGIATNLAVNAGGVSSGVMPNATVRSSTGTTITLSNPVAIEGGVSGVPSGQPVTVSSAITSAAVVGTYVLTAVNGTTWSLTTVPSGGHSQSNVSISGNVLTLDDMVLLINGTPNTGDTITVVVPTPATKNVVVNIDKANNISDPFFEALATGSYASSANPLPTVAGSGIVIQSLYMGGGLYGTWQPNTAPGAYSLSIGGSQNTSSGSYSAVVGGFINSATTIQSAIVGGGNVSLTGPVSSAVGAQQATDFGRYNYRVFASGRFLTQGDAQAGETQIRGNGSSASAIRLTADANAAGSTNILNIPNNTIISFDIQITAFDHTTIANWLDWATWTGVMTRGASVSTTTVSMRSTPTPLTGGTTTGAAISVTADTTNGGLNVSFTPPTGNTDTWHVVANIRVRNEVQ